LCARISPSEFSTHAKTGSAASISEKRDASGGVVEALADAAMCVLDMAERSRFVQPQMAVLCRTENGA